MAANHLILQKPLVPENSSMTFKRIITKHVFLISMDYLFCIKIIRQYLVKTLLPRFFGWKWNFTMVHAEQHMTNAIPSFPTPPTNKPLK